MNELPFGDPTLRERIMRVFEARFLARSRGVNDAAVTWDVATRKPLTAEQQKAGYAVGIYDTSEKKVDRVGCVECMLNVVFEFHVTVAEGDDAEQLLNNVLGEVQTVALLDVNMAEEDGYQLAIDVVEKGNEIEFHAAGATKVAGMVIVEVRYKHRVGNPRRR